VGGGDRFTQRLFDENASRFKASRQRRAMQTLRLTDKAEAPRDIAALQAVRSVVADVFQYPRIALQRHNGNVLAIYPIGESNEKYELNSLQIVMSRRRI